jgi:cell division septation protein DedD
MDNDTQLELFELSRTTGSFRSRMSGIGSLHLRYDHAMLCGMVALIAVAVVFGVGVERGKVMARSDRTWSGTQFGAVPATVPSASAPAPQPATVSKKTIAIPAPAAKPKTPTRVANEKTGYAIQVVAYTKTKFAQRELNTLLGRGEPAFLMERNDGRMVLCIGPFPSRERASVTLSRVKPRYQDCFIRTL